MKHRNRGAIGQAAALLIALAGCAPAPAPAGPEDPLRVAVISDLNSAYGATTYEPEVHTAVRLLATEWKPDLVLIAGDLIAGQRPTLTDSAVHAMWDAFDAAVARPLRSAGIELAFTVGNHDGSGHPAHGRDRRIVAERWGEAEARTGLTVLDAADFPFRYAFTLGGVFFLVMDASTGRVMADSTQVAWMRRTLDTPAAEAARMRISIGHVPLYAVAIGRNRPGEVQEQPNSLRELLEEGGVRMHISGHHHAYFPGRRGRLDLLYTGALGQGSRPLLAGDAEPFQSLTLLDVWTRQDSIAIRTYRIDGDSVNLVDHRSLPERIEGINGFVQRRDIAKQP